MSTLSKIRFKNKTPYILPPKIYKGDELVYDISEDIDYSTMYFTIESLEDNNVISFIRGGAAYHWTYYWSLDNGVTWTSHNDTASQTLNARQKLLMKCTWDGFYERMVENGNWHFSSTKTFNVYGNTMSLLYGDDFVGQTRLRTMGDDVRWYTFCLLFKKCKVVSAKNLILPATSLSRCCYDGMFAECSSLIAAPELPATNLYQLCYSGMFRDCKSLVVGPSILPAKYLAQGSYAYMFYGTSLTKITCLAINISPNLCTDNWVTGISGSGTFYKAPSMSSWPTGNSGIPEGWTVVDYVE